jgi:hypothetical protein
MWRLFGYMFTNGDETLANSIKQSTQQRGKTKNKEKEREDPSPSQKKQNSNWVTLIVV